MNFRGHKKKRKKFQANAEVDLACSQQKVDRQAGSELCITSLQGLFASSFVQILIIKSCFLMLILSHMFSLLYVLFYFYVLDKLEHAPLYLFLPG